MKYKVISLGIGPEQIERTLNALAGKGNLDLVSVSTLPSLFGPGITLFGIFREYEEGWIGGTD